MKPDDENEHWKKDEMEAAEAILEWHESKLSFDAAQVNFHNVHVDSVEYEEDLKQNIHSFTSTENEHKQ